jgi:RecB family exonuclease
MNYYFHCKRQCYLHGNRLNLEDTSESVKIGKALHEEREERLKDTELEIENIKLDGLTSKYLIEIKKSDADIEASKWQIMLYLKTLKEKGVIREGKLEFVEKNKQMKNIIYVNLDHENEKQLERYIQEIQELLLQDEVPQVLNQSTCKKCAYYEYCYI